MPVASKVITGKAQNPYKCVKESLTVQSSICSITILFRLPPVRCSWTMKSERVRLLVLGLASSDPMPIMRTMFLRAADAMQETAELCALPGKAVQ